MYYNELEKNTIVFFVVFICWDQIMVNENNNATSITFIRNL